MTEETKKDPQEPELTAKPRELTEEELEKLKREELDYWSELGNLYSA